MMQPSDTLFVGSSELAALMRSTDWGRTAVGVPEQWPQSVRAIVRLMLTSRYAMWMGWGPDLTFFYNDAYAGMTLGEKHPWALGKPAALVWAEQHGEFTLRDLNPRPLLAELASAARDAGSRLSLPRPRLRRRGA